MQNCSCTSNPKVVSHMQKRDPYGKDGTDAINEANALNGWSNN
jgi:hypothetical protein